MAQGRRPAFGEQAVFTANDYTDELRPDPQPQELEADRQGRAL